MKAVIAVYEGNQTVGLQDRASQVAMIKDIIYGT